MATRFEDLPVPSSGITVVESELATGLHGTGPLPEFVDVVDKERFDSEWKKIRASSESNDQKAALDEAFRDYQNIASPKIVGQATPETILALDDLRLRFPNFADLVDALRAECLRALTRQSASLKGQRYLLAGPPGIGKSQVVRAIASALRLPVTEIRLSSCTSGFEIAGLSRHWANTAPGAIAHAYAESHFANPLFFLDEVDKGPLTGGTYGRSLDALLALAEPGDARQFWDNCLKLNIDAHRAFILATANDPELLPDHFRSRFIELNVRQPTAEQMRHIIAALYAEEIRDEPGLWEPSLAPDVVDALVKLPPRSAKIAIGSAARRAVLRMHATSNPPSPVTIGRQDLLLESRQERRPSIGFGPW